MSTDSDTPSDDAAVMAAVAEGDRTALRLLYYRHAPWLTVRLSRRCSDADLVDTAVQDTFVAVWRSAAAYRGEGEVAGWLWGIAIRRLIDAIRRSSRRNVVEVSGRTEPSAEELVLLGIEHGDLGGALQRLSPELRAVVRATVLDGLTTREAAHLLGIPHGTVKTRMMRARAQLRQELA